MFIILDKTILHRTIAARELNSVNGCRHRTAHIGE